MRSFPIALLVLICVCAAAGQGPVPYVPCLVDVQDYSKAPTGLVLVNGEYEVPEPLKPIWKAPKATPVVYKIGGGSSWQIPIVMPVAGKCAGSFEAYDDRDDLAVVVTDALGRYIRKQPPGDIEILIVDEMGFAAMNRAQNYFAYYSSGRQFSGQFEIPLATGHYHPVISNRHSLLARKSVKFSLGRAEITR